MQLWRGVGLRWRSIGPVIPIILGFVIVSLAFNASVPLLEAPDEPSHVALVRFIATRQALPIQRPPGYFPVGQEGSQPPLYYALGAALLRLSPGPPLAPTFASHNPFVTFDRTPSDWNNRNLYAHTAQEGFPYRGDVLGIHLVRLLGTVLGSITVLFTFLIARHVFANRPLVPVLAASLVAFNPQFAFVSGVVNNDNAIIATATVVLYCLVRWAMRGGSARLSVALGLALGAALLAKTDGILLVPFVGLVLLVDVLGRKKIGDVLKRALLIATLAAAMAGWWFVRNQVLYGDPIGWEAMLAANGSMLRHPPIDVWAATRVLWNARGTFWGAFGWTNVLYPDAIYRLLELVSGVAIAGLLISLRHPGSVVAAWSDRVSTKQPLSRAASAPSSWQRLTDFDERGRLLARIILIAWPCAVFASLVQWVQVNVAADQWRLLFPAIGAGSIFLAAGWDEVGRVVLTGFETIRTSARRLKKTGAMVAESPVRVGAPSEGIAALVRERPAVARLAPSTGGSIDADSVGSQLTAVLPPRRPRSASSGTGLRLVPWAVAAIGVGINLLVLKSVIFPTFYPTTLPATVAAAGRQPDQTIHFGGVIELVGYRVRPARLSSGDTLEVDLEWKTSRTVGHNWAVSLGVVGEGNVTLARAQSWPQGGRAPTTAWEPGKIYPDRYYLPIRWRAAQPQLASVWLNLYDASTAGGPSLPVTDAAGRSLGTGIVIARVKLEPTEKTAQRPSHVVGAHFGPEIDLVGYDSVVEADKLQVTLFWRDLTRIPEPYTVFVHLARADGHVVAQHDGPPRDGAYPTTVWDVGEVIQDQHTIVLKGVPPGRYQVLVGLYRRSTGQRLPVQIANGEHVPDDALHLFDLTVPRGLR